MKLVGSGTQLTHHPYYRADGTITSGSSPQLVLGQSLARSTLFFQNISSATMFLEIGVGSATAVITNGAVTSITGVNNGFGFTYPPVVRLLGGGPPQVMSGNLKAVYNNRYTGLAQPNAPAPTNVATAFATISAGVITGYTITNPGSGYLVAPYVHLVNSDLDPNGAAAPTATVGIELTAGQSVAYNGTFCPTDPVAVFCASAGSAFICRWSD